MKKKIGPKKVARVRRKKPKMMRPRDARTSKQVCKMPRDNLDYGGFWMLLNGTGFCSVSITAQKTGENATQSISIPRHVFDHFVDWYMKPVKVSP